MRGIALGVARAQERIDTDNANGAAVDVVEIAIAKHDCGASNRGNDCQTDTNAEPPAAPQAKGIRQEEARSYQGTDADDVDIVLKQIAPPNRRGHDELRIGMSW